MSSALCRLLPCVLIFGTVAAAGEKPKPPDGVHVGSAKGYKGPVEVKVTVKGGKIAAVKITGHKESRPGKSLSVIPRRIVEKQSANVDAVTGATVTSKAIMKATDSALKKARAAPAPGALKDGTYRGSARGYEAPVQVEVTVKKGKITAARVLAHKESAPGKSIKIVPARIVAKRSAKVDAVTGATVTSNAIMKAAGAALEKARAAPAPPALKDGKYRGSARGYEGPVHVEVSVKKDRITAVRILEHKESAPGESLKTVPARIVAKQSPKVDAVTGATITSKAIIKATGSALKKAGPGK